MSVEHIGKGYVKICVREEELENSIAGLSQLKPILQTQVMKGNGRNTKQGIIDAAEQEVYDRYLQITGYCKCCVDCNFIDQKGADELMCLAAYLAGNEQARAEVQQKAGKKA